MDKTTLKQLKPGTLFRLKDSESSPSMGKRSL
jgi:hypothetical protein